MSLDRAACLALGDRLHFPGGLDLVVGSAPKWNRNVYSARAHGADRSYALVFDAGEVPGDFEARWGRVPLFDPSCPWLYRPIVYSRPLRSTGEVGGYRVSAGPRVDGPLCAVLPEPPYALLAKAVRHAVLGQPWPVSRAAWLIVEVARHVEEAPDDYLSPVTIGIDRRGVFRLDRELDLAFTHPPFPPGTWKGVVPWVAYNAPERLLSASRSASFTRDGLSYGLGTLLYELVVGARMFPGDSDGAIPGQLRGPPPSLRRRAQSVPVEVADCAHALLDHDPLHRPDPALLVATLAPFAARDPVWEAAYLASASRPLDIPHMAGVRV